MGEQEHTHTKDHVIIVPSPGMGHLIPLTEFAKLLHSNHTFSISLLLPTTTSAPTSAQSAYLSGLPSDISYTFLPPVDPALLPDDVAHEVTIDLTHLHSATHLRDSIARLTRSTRVVALVTDLFGTNLFGVAREFGVLPYLYFTSTAMCLSLFLHLPLLDETVSCEYRDMVDPLVLPGCVPLHGKDFVDTVKNRKDEAYKVIMDQIKRYKLAEGIFINTFMDLEPGALHNLQNDNLDRPPIYPVGPIIQSGLGDGPDGSDILSWLDRQQPDSVLFVSFGSGGTLSYEQLIELAIGLEKSGQRFLWVVRSPSKSSFGSFFSGKSQDDPFGFFPDGYMDRIANRGLLVPSWAPQIEVLSHKSTGGFLSHCGWNSTLESIVYGVPLIAWPLYAEQRMNAVMLNEGVKVALRPKETEGDLVEAEEIAKVVRELMEGEEGKRVHQRMKELSEYAKMARSEDGVSTKLLNQVVHKWQS
ncbi:hypothetical protein KSS87_021583 [Heliosperma pusillum]|nr:hypothetical protein KSS87_021583 [Heliosperma pusillum]